MMFLLIGTQAMLVAIVFFQGLEIRALYRRLADLSDLVTRHHIALNPRMTTIWRSPGVRVTPKDYEHE